MIGRKLQTPDADTLDAGLFGFDQDRRGGGQQPQYFKTQGRHGRALGTQHHRHPPHDAVALGPDREQAAPGGRLFQNMDVAQQPGKIEQEALRVLAEHRKPRHRKRLVEIRRITAAARSRPIPRAIAGSHRQKSDRCSAVRATCFGLPRRDSASYRPPRRD